MFSSDEAKVRIAEANARVVAVAQAAHNHLESLILPHLDGTCRCRKPERCRVTVREQARFAARTMRAFGAKASK